MNPNARNGLTEKLCPICQYPEFDPRCPHWGPNEPAAPYDFQAFMEKVLEPLKPEELRKREAPTPDMRGRS